MDKTRRRAGTVALITCAAVVVPVAPASAAWQHAELHAVYVQRVCQDGVQLRLARIDFGGDEPAPDPVSAHLAVAEPPPDEIVPEDPPAEPPTRYPVPPKDVVVDAVVVLERLPQAEAIVTDDQQEFRLSHLRKAKHRFSRTLRVGTTVGISPADFATSAAVLRHPVKRCRLFR